ncbi:unnamed protein product [Anisakis simplex]|uniref:CCR4-NOT transcription complex subunit 9 n=1 Tax=Anisakis simplex TaxID=6269 RepID=A0A0M3K149_ANISI|nr:unnamed protein product [Anisakis simplex]
MVLQLAKEPSQRLLKHVVRCYSRLSDNPRHVYQKIVYSIVNMKSVKSMLDVEALQALRQCLPDQLKDETFSRVLEDDKSTKHWLQQLMKNLGLATD